MNKKFSKIFLIIFPKKFIIKLKIYGKIFIYINDFRHKTQFETTITEINTTAENVNIKIKIVFNFSNNGFNHCRVSHVLNYCNRSNKNKWKNELIEVKEQIIVNSLG